MILDESDRRLASQPRILVWREVYGLARIYWSMVDVERMTAVAQLESGFNTGAWNQTNEDSRGLWQINVSPAAWPDLAGQNLWDPQINAYWAYFIWQRQGYRAWYNSSKRLGLL